MSAVPLPHGEWLPPKADPVSGAQADRAIDWRDGLIRNKDGNPKALLANSITALRDAPEWLGVLAHNEFSRAIAALRNPPWGTVQEWTDNEDRLAAQWLQQHGIYVGVEVAGQAVQVVAEQQRFHPVRQYLDSLKWDGTKRIDTWLSLYLGAEASDYTAAVGARWLISATARIYQPGCKADCTPVLEGLQGIKKSTSLKTIAGEYFTDEMADMGSKDAALQTRGVWIIEIAELDSMTRSEVGRIKAFMSRTTDRFRPPYGKRLIESPRQCVFAGTVNHTTYLRDETGGRRFWPIACSTIRIDELARDRDQLWAEAVSLYRRGSPWWLDSLKLTRAAEDEQAARYEGDPWDALILEWATARITSGCDSVSIGEALELCLTKPKQQWEQRDQNRVARCLRAANWERYRDRRRDMEWRYRPCSQS